MTVLRTVPRNGKPIELGRYRALDGERRLVGQRVDTAVRLTDVPRVLTARRYVVEPDLSDPAELAAVVADYLEQAAAHGECPMRCLPI